MGLCYTANAKQVDIGTVGYCFFLYNIECFVQIAHYSNTLHYLFLSYRPSPPILMCEAGRRKGGLLPACTSPPHSVFKAPQREKLDLLFCLMLEISPEYHKKLTLTGNLPYIMRHIIDYLLYFSISIHLFLQVHQNTLTGRIG